MIEGGETGESDAISAGHSRWHLKQRQIMRIMPGRPPVAAIGNVHLVCSHDGQEGRSATNGKGVTSVVPAVYNRRRPHSG